jgi:hypothetical protein
MRKSTLFAMSGLQALCFCSLGLAGCSGGDNGQGNDAGTSDGGQRDAVVDVRPDSSLATNIGTRCSGTAACLAGSPFCLTLDQVTAEGICTRPCTPDSPATPAFNEDNCPLGAICAVTTLGSFCLKTCTPSLEENTCGAESGLACNPNSVLLIPTGRRTVCLSSACESDLDCPVLTADACSGDASCEATYGEDAYCHTAELNDDVLQVCALPGKCTPGGICGPHGRGKEGARVGDPCQSDLDCTDNGFCWIEREEDGFTVRPNGYCSIANCAFADTLPEFDCSSAEAATCALLDPRGLCYRTCDPGDAESCRRDISSLDKGGDYECYSYEQLELRDGRPIATAPVCESAQSCVALGSQVSCSDLAPSGNAQNMSCRDRRTGEAKGSEDDEDGVCLDDTASGEFEQPDGGVGPDAG